jgi:hypothetical protein
LEVWRPSTSGDGVEEIISIPFHGDEDTGMTKPAKFFSNFFDVSRLSTNVAGIRYTETRE